MSSISIDIPTLQVDANDLKNLMSFIYKHEELLKKFGGIKLKPNSDCKLALKKRRKNLMLPPTSEQILQMSKNEGIYCVQKTNHINKLSQENSMVIDKCSFWSSLRCSNNKGRYLNTALVSNASFFTQKTSRLYFDLHRLPNQSLLKIGGSEMVRQFNPCVRRALKPGAIFPLTCSQHRLFSIDYHHEGGDHHWYIIPNCEREILQKVLDQEDSSFCLDHGQLLIDPSILDKNHIRYHRIIQHPKELIVLSPGTLAQSFADDASWSESINFALPSWIEDGHTTVSPSLCQCHISQSSVPKTIDISLFKPELIEKYITTYLDIINYEKTTLKEYNNMNVVTTAIPNNIRIDSSNAEFVIPTNIEPSLLSQTIVSSFHTPPPSLTPSSVDSNVFDEEKNNSTNNYVQTQYQLIEEGVFQNIFDIETSKTTQINSVSNEYLFGPNIRTNALYQTMSASKNAHRNATNNYNMDNNFLSFEELMDWLPSSSDNIASKYEYKDESIYTTSSSTPASNGHVAVTSKQNYVKRKDISNRIQNNRKTLFISGLRANVNADDIRRHFTGCEKVTIKRYRITPDLKYAFVMHRTSRDAMRNLRRSIDFHILGPECRVEYARNCSNLPYNQQNFDQKKIVVSHIPLNVYERDLQDLFVNCRVIEFCPARTIHPATITARVENNSNILRGHAILLYDNEQLAAGVIKHADQYEINGKLLSVSLYRSKKSLYTSAR